MRKYEAHRQREVNGQNRNNEKYLPQLLPGKIAAGKFAQTLPDAEVSKIFDTRLRMLRLGPIHIQDLFLRLHQTTNRQTCAEGCCRQEVLMLVLFVRFPCL